MMKDNDASRDSLSLGQGYNEDSKNNRCDALAIAAARRKENSELL